MGDFRKQGTDVRDPGAVLCRGLLVPTGKTWILNGERTYDRTVCRRLDDAAKTGSGVGKMESLSQDRKGDRLGNVGCGLLI